jgi:3-dehydrotetronate 4-kinase
MAILFGAVADDDTGATDLAGMLADQGVRAVLAIDLPVPARLSVWAEDCDAVILGVGSRALAAAAAYDRMRDGFRLLETLRPGVLQVKYCSTFDSTAEGNIGPSIDAALDELGEAFTIALPALPVNGRTTYMGYHFVHQHQLSESPMRHHPLTPMTNSNLVTHLQSQTRRKVGLAPYPDVRAGARQLRDCFDRLRDSGVSIAIVDCTTGADIEVICQAARGLRLITGSSAPAMMLPGIWERQDGWKPRDRTSLLPGHQERRCEAAGRGFLVVAGSCSQATQGQNDVLAGRDARIVELDGVRLAAGEDDFAPIISAAAAELAGGRACLLRTAGDLDDVNRVHQWARRNDLNEAEAGRRIAFRLAAIVRDIVQCSPPEGLIVAGGETAGAVCRTLHFGALRVGPNIAPGVPLCVSLGEISLPVVLKSGNFGGPDFYDQAMAAVRALRNE